MPPSAPARCRPGFQDTHRSVRAEAELHPRLLRHDEEGRHGHCDRRSQGRQARARCLKCKGRETQADRRRRAGDIVAIAKMEDLHTGTVLGEVELPKMAFPTPMVGLAVTPKSRGDEAKLSGLAAQDRRGRSDVPDRPRSADQRNGDDRHERTASADHSRAAPSPRQAGRRHQRAKNSLPRNDSDQCRREVSPQKAIGRPRAVRRSSHPHVSVAPRHQDRGVRHQGAFPAV